jgi:cold shock CspA family protein
MERLIGRVKWFNFQNGYGFITPINPVEGAQDIFVHHTTINVSGNQYRYLMEGEYVEFTLESVNSREHNYHAVDITGINRNILMCETKNKLSERHKPVSPYPPKLERQSSRVPTSHRQNSSFPPQFGDQKGEDGFEFPKQKRVSRSSST